MSIFSDLTQLSSETVDAVMGELFQFVAMKAGASVNLPRISDGARPDFSAIGVFRAPSQAKYPRGRDRIVEDAAHQVDVSVPRVSVANRLLSWSPLPGDRAVRDATGEKYEIAKVLPDGAARTYFLLTAKQR